MGTRLIIFSGYNMRAVIAFLRTLAKNGVQNYSIFASSSTDPIFLTAYAEQVEYIRKKKELDWDELCMAIDAVREKHKIKECMIVPSTEALNRSVLANRGLLREHCCGSPMPDQELYITISDKKSFWRVCKERGFCVPKEIGWEEPFQGPLVAKPCTYAASDHRVYAPIIISTEGEFLRFLKNYPVEDFTLQEYVDGESYYLLYYFTRSGEVFRFSQINHAQQYGGKSILAAACADLHCSDISKRYEALFFSLGYYGFLMLELRKRGEDYYMIEANPRFWGPSQLFCDAGCNFFEVFLWEYGCLGKEEGADIPEMAQIMEASKRMTDAKYLWSGGVEQFPTEKCVWHGRGREQVEKDREKYWMADIYKREDTMGIWEAEAAKWNGGK